MQINEECRIELYVLNSNNYNHFSVHKQMINIKRNY